MSAGAATDLRARVTALRADCGYAELLDALRVRLEAAGRPASVTLTGLGDAARRALADLLGRRRTPDSTVRVIIEEMDRALRTSRVNAGLLEVLEAMAGPLVDRRALRAAGRNRWIGLWARLEAHPRIRERPALRRWVGALRADGLLLRLAGDVDAGERLLERAVSVVAELPAGGQSLAVLAASCTGDPHALDHGTPLATLVLRAAVQVVDDERLPSSQAARRRLWARVGVVCDPLSTDVLVLNLPSRREGLLARTLVQHAEAGEPLRLTLRVLERYAFDLESDRKGEVVHVCENPAVLLAAADALGAACAPLVCVEGMPGVAAERLLTAIRIAGATLRFHVDFDWGGMRIGNLLVARHAAEPWRMGVGDYEAGLATTQVSCALGDRIAKPVWDDELAAEMLRAGRALAEERVLEALFADLGPKAPSGSRPQEA